jgi:DNA-directed RNA polymerase
VLDGLNALMSTRWSVNERVLRIVQYLWEAKPHGLPFLADTPASVAMPLMPDISELSEEEVHTRQARHRPHAPSAIACCTDAMPCLKPCRA